MFYKCSANPRGSFGVPPRGAAQVLRTTNRTRLRAGLVQMQYENLSNNLAPSYSRRVTWRPPTVPSGDADGKTDPNCACAAKDTRKIQTLAPTESRELGPEIPRFPCLQGE